MKIALIVGNGQSTKLLYDYGFHNIPSHIDVYWIHTYQNTKEWFLCCKVKKNIFKVTK